MFYPVQYVETGRITLERAEEELRTLIAKAASAGQYGDVALLVEWAQHLAELLRGSSDARESAPGNGAPGTTALAPHFPRSDASGNDGQPGFFRNANVLVRRALSKRKGEQYEHRAPREVLDAVLAALSRAGARNRAVSVERLAPLKTKDNREIPNYQAYLVLALLKDAGAVEQLGRQGYKLTIGKKDPLAVAQEIWSTVPEQADVRG